jgi:hypothetical protein
MSIFRPERDLKDKRGNNWTVRFRSIEQYAMTLDRSIEDHSEKNYHASKADREMGKNWFGTSSIEEYRDMLRDGWPTGVKDTEGLDGLCTDLIDRFSLVPSVAGAFANVPAFLAGHPQSMYQLRTSQSEKRGVSLVIDSCFSGGLRGETILNYAKSIMRLIAWLQTQQIETSVYVTVPIVFQSKRFIYLTPVREAGQILQPERIAACLHPSWLRRAWFSMVEYEAQVDNCQYSKSGVKSRSYGSVIYNDAEILRQVLPEAFAVILLPKPGEGNPENAVKETLNLKLRRD